MGNLTKWGYTAAALLGCLGMARAQAYEVTVHARMTGQAIDRIVAENDFHARLGVRPDRGFAQVFDFTSFGQRRVPRTWILGGSIWEDDVVNFGPSGALPRSAFHFFDPTTGVGLNGNPNRSSLLWATSGDLNPVYSIPQARQSMFRALTTVDPIVREHFWADTFRAVGQFTHLLQDTAQPQHVRDDIHLSFSEPISRALPGLFPRWSRYESFTTQLAVGGSYPRVDLPTFTSYWTTADRKGLADFTNRNFVSEQTNFRQPGGTRFAEPAEPTNPAAFTEVIIPQVFDLDGNTPIPNATNIAVRFVSNTAQDNYAPGQSAANPKLSAFSVLDFQHFTTTGQHVYSLYNDNHQAYFELLGPRAVGYSAGIMNYFFRGALEIAEPDEVVYAMVDPFQSETFTKLKLKIRNATPNESTEGGTVRAVAKYHRNTCYKPDLTGEAEAPGIDILACRGAEEEISVSATQSAPSLPANGAFVPLTFDFSGSPIPVGVFDLFVQVIYQGTLGDEKETALAVGTKDIFEPTHLTYMNATDVYEINDVFYRRARILAGIAAGDPLFAGVDLNADRTYLSPPDAPLVSTDLSAVPVSFRAPGVSTVATIPSLPNGRFARMTVLTDRPRLDFYPGPLHFQPAATRNQVEGNTFFVIRVNLFRDVYVTGALVLTFCVWTTTCNSDLTNMLTSEVTDATKPMPVTVNIP
jgi:hypothetical protein